MFHWKSGGKLAAEIGGVSKGEILSPELCEALFSVFLDDASVVERKDLVGRLGDLAA